MAVIGAALVAPALAAPPAERTLTVPSSPGTHVVRYSGHAPFDNFYAHEGDVTHACGGTPGPTRDGTETPKDKHRIAVVVPRGVMPRNDVLLRFQIDSAVNRDELENLELYVFAPDGSMVGKSFVSRAVNVTAPVTGVYTALACAEQSGPLGVDYNATVTAMTLPPARVNRAPGVIAPTYRAYLAPRTAAASAGEPSIGSNWRTGRTLYTAGLQEYVVAFDDRRGTSTWTEVNTDPTDPSNKASFDPIGYTDSETGRTFVSQLVFACSAGAFSDDDFSSPAIPIEGCGSGINGFDHQTFGSGPFPKGLLPASAYPHAVYYCSQAPALVAATATCARSDDGGVTFGPPVPVYVGPCGGIHGHVRVGPEGTVYLPNAHCGTHQALAVSEDGGTTWVLRPVPDSFSSLTDPSVSAGRDGTVYFGYTDGSGRPKIAVSTNHGKTWSKSADVSAPFGIRNTVFADVIAGDGDRAAFAFVGTTTRGDTQSATFGLDRAEERFTGGAWHLYIATTYDRGRHWVTVDATPHDPVQRGCIWTTGGSSKCRNLLDFNDITIDKLGRVMVGFADGCVDPDADHRSDCVRSAAVEDNGRAKHGAIIRQLTGKGLFHQYDGRLPSR